MRKIILFQLFVLFFLQSFSQLPSKLEIIDKMRLVNDYWISQNQVPGNNQWARATYFTGNMDFHKIYPKTSYLEYATSWANNNNWTLNSGIFTRNADNQTCGQVYIDLYNLDDAQQINKISAISQSINNMVNSSKSDDWWWIDALYMAMPVFTRMGIMMNDSTYFNRMYELYTDNKIRRGLFNTSKGLWFRDETYKPPYTTKNGQESYWSRGNGWVIAAHTRVLQMLPLNNSHRAEYMSTFQQMAAALKDRQRSDGFWNVSLDDPNEYSGPETSGTAFFTYAIAWGINNHLLDSLTYYSVVEKAWNGLTSIAVQSNGFVGYVQGVGAGPAFAPQNSTQDFGVGAFLLAGTEVVKLAKGTLPIPYNFGIKSVKAIDKTHVSVTFNNKFDAISALNSLNYSINNEIKITSIIQGNNDSTTVLTVSEMGFGTYQLMVNNIKSFNGNSLENGETKTFSFSGINSVTASGYEGGTSNTPDKTLDFDFNTRWSCDGKGAWILYDLGELKNVLSVDLAFFNGSVRKAFFSINLSKDGENFNEVYNGNSNGTTTNLENYNFKDSLARYVKIIGYGNSQSTWNSITETRINWQNVGTGIVSHKVEELDFYPNPLKKGDILNIRFNENAENELNLTDISGKIIYSKKINNQNFIRFNDIQLNKGIYFIRIKNRKEEKTGKLMVE